MKTRTEANKFVVVYILALLFVGACNRSGLVTVESGESPEPQNSLTAAAFDILTESPFATAPVIPTPTNTPHPKLSEEEARKLALEMEVTNGGCQHPCYWGIVPSETSWEEARNFFESLGASVNYSSGLNVYFVDLPNWEEIEFPGAIIIVSDDLVDVIIRGAKMSVSEVLITSGLPTEIWISIGDDSPFGPLNFNLVFFYAEHGFMIYWGGNPIVKGESVDICLEHIRPEDSTPITFWRPDPDRFFKEIGDPMLFYGKSSETYFLLEDITDIDVQYFYETYIDPDNISECFETPNPYYYGE